jgi:hypothetical protein
MSHVPWSRVEEIHEGLLANVGECLVHRGYEEFRAARSAWSALRLQLPDPVQRYGSAVFGEAGRQWEEHLTLPLDVDLLDSVIAGTARGLQPVDLRAALKAIPAGEGVIRCFLGETLQLLLETIDLNL